MSQAFIPKPLTIHGQPELEVFSYNIMFMSYGVSDGQARTGTAIYIPDLTTYRQEEDVRYLTYVNTYMGQDYIDLRYHETDGRYEADKYVRGTHVSYTYGKDWQSFFLHLTAPGLSPREGCSFADVPEDV
jgi:hypothetical protein